MDRATTPEDSPEREPSAQLMEAVILISVIVVMTPFIILALNSGHLVRSVADWISGKRAGAKELKEMKTRIDILESELHELRGKYISLEEMSEFSMKLLDDMKRTESNKAIGQDGDSQSD